MSTEPETRFRLVLHYDGSRFLGWQSQPGGRTVQGEVEGALERLTGARRPVVAAGRTDRGVHATGQVAGVTLPSRWEAGELRRGLNALLPGDVWIREAAVAPGDFHPRRDALSRSYRYQVGAHPLARSPFHRPWCWPLARDPGREPGPELDRELLERAALLLPGDRSLRAFARSGQRERGDRCLVMEARWVEWEPLGVAFRITADRFLHHTVRYLVGTMVDIARRRRPLETLQALLEDPPGAQVTSPPAPPEGLFLTGVAYPPEKLSLPDREADPEAASGRGSGEGPQPHYPPPGFALD